MFQNFKLKQIIYPVILVIYCIIAILLFIYATNFLAKNINAAFVVDESLVESREAKLDMTGLEAVGEKLGFVVGGSDTVSALPTSSIIEMATTTATTTAAVETATSTVATTTATTTQKIIKQTKKK